MAAPTFFEGTEKKVEIAVDPSLPSLRGLGESFWRRIVAAAGAHVLSLRSNDRCDAYLLAESSLFVFDHKMLMITCGRTRLPEAVLELLRHVPADQVSYFIYERKNEAFPHRQPTSFFDDVRVLAAVLPGRAYRFGEEDGHHIYLFHLDGSLDIETDDTTVEILMYGIDDAVRAEFVPGAGTDLSALRSRTGVDRILPGFDIDDHLFVPGGYSLNGIRGDEYWTLHVTPEEIGSYVSFETNHRFGDALRDAVARVLDTFRPRSFDLMTFEQSDRLAFRPRGYELGTHVERDLDCGFRVRFLSFFRPHAGIGSPVELPVPGPAPVVERT